MITFKLLSGHSVPPYKNVRSIDDLEAMAKKMIRDKDKVPSYKIEQCFSHKVKPSRDLIDFLHNCLVIDINKRKSARQLLAHRWLQKNARYT